MHMGLPPLFNNVCHHSTREHTHAHTHTFCSVALFSPLLYREHVAMSSNTHSVRMHFRVATITNGSKRTLAFLGHLSVIEAIALRVDIVDTFWLLFLIPSLPKLVRPWALVWIFVFGMTRRGSKDRGWQWISSYSFLPPARCPSPVHSVTKVHTSNALLGKVLKSTVGPRAASNCELWQNCFSEEMCAPSQGPSIYSEIRISCWL